MLKICVLLCLLATTFAFNLACTAECSAYYVCKAKGAWNGNTANCPYPQGCECRKFAWQKDQESADFPWVTAAKLGYQAYQAIKNRRDSEESDLSVTGNVCVTTKWGKVCGSRDEIESEFLPALAPAAIFAGKALAAGALSAAGAHAYDRFIRRRDNTESEFPIVPVAIGAWKLYNALKKDNVESDFSIRGVISKAKEYYPKAKAVYGEGKNIYNSVQNIRNILKKDDVESEFPIVPVAIGAWKLYNALKKDGVEADAEFLGKIAGKVKGVVSKGMNIYNKAKPFIGIAKNFIDSEEADFLGALKLGFKAFKAIKGLKQKKQKQPKQQPEADMLKDLIARLKDKIKAKLAKLKEKKAAKTEKPVQEQADFKIDKCQVCKAGCTLIKDESKRNLCIQACETFACK